MKRMAKWLFLLLWISWIVGCATEEIALRDMSEDITSHLLKGLPSYPQARILLFSDPHLYDPSLGTSGEAFEEYLLDDRKLLAESVEILQEAVRRMISENADFIVIPGDLTKDGEKLSHELMAGYLTDLEREGFPVYVVAGNHDIANPHAFRYEGDQTEPVESISSDDFRRIYRSFGFDEAIASDPHSLSYVAVPVPGLRLLALDSCRYRENEESPVTGGRFYPETLDWIQGQLEAAVMGGEAMIAVMHHGIVEHYEGQAKFHPQYVVEDHEPISRMFAQYGVRIVFTGHYHAQDVTFRRWEDEKGSRFLFDIETGSLVTSPSPYRIAQITSDQSLIAESRFIDRISSRPEGFVEYSREYLIRGLEEVVVNTLRGYRVSERSARRIAPQVVAALEAHYAGDEVPPARILSLDGVGPWGRFIAKTRRYFLEGLWNDLEPSDNRLVIHLDDGTWE